MNYKLLLISLAMMVYTSSLCAQTSGEIKYDRKVYYSRIIDGLPYLSEEEKDRQKLTWGKDDGWSHPYVLQFNDKQSVYTYGKEEKSYSYSWKKEEFWLMQDQETGEVKHQKVLGGKLYLVEDESPKHKWKILNEIREVAGHLCMKAETQDSIKGQTIHAWFATEIPIAIGPEGFGGLPGAILMLEINDGTAIIEASEVNLDRPITIETPKKIKGKSVSIAEYTAVLDKYFKQCLEGERNPFWQARY